MRRIFTVFLAFAILIFPIFIFTSSTGVFAQTREELEKELSDLEAQIKLLTSNISQTQKQGASLKTDIKVLEQKIAQSKLKIKAHNAAISKLSQSIGEKNKNITSLNNKIDREKDSLAQILRKSNYMSNYTVLDFTFQNDNLSSFFADVDAFQTVNRALQNSFAEIRGTKVEIEGVKKKLEEDKDEEIEKKLAQELERKKVESNQKEKNNLLTVTKNQEADYKKVLAAREREAAQIRARLFELRDAGSISFGQAYDFALSASKTTGVRPALILAILMQESSLGINLGSCYIRDYTTGAGISIKTGETKIRVMHPTRDMPVFDKLMAKLGKDPLSTQVSCWIASYSGGSPVGWGGAMGPSQFIPSTWVLFEDRIRSITGSSVANPWNAYHAITATALYLADLGAVAGNEAAERNAACKYYSGRSCSSSSAGAGYGNSVMRKVAATQLDIDKLQR